LYFAAYRIESTLIANGHENTRKTKPVIDAPNYTSVTITDEPEFREFTDTICPLLTKDNRCSIYENRPMICNPYPLLLDRVFDENLVPVLIIVN
jgi:Fe-S-cluster containining protein